MSALNAGNRLNSCNPAETKQNAALSAPSYSEQIKKKAKKLNDDGSIYVAYGFLDVLNLAPKMIEIGYGVTYGMTDGEENLDSLYDWMRTPEGLWVVALSVLPISILSAVANGYYSSETAQGKAFYRTWQSTRDATKGIKNALRGTKNTISALQLLTLQNFSYLLMPAGFSFAILSFANRLWNRRMVNRRKDLMDDNKQLVNRLDQWGTFKKIFALPSEGSDELAKHINGFRLVEDHRNPENDGLYYISYNTDTKKAESHRIPLTADEIARLVKEIHSSEIINPKKPSILQWDRLLPGIAKEYFLAFHQDMTERAFKNTQAKTEAHKCYASATYAGFIDGLYMFMGLITLCPMSPAVLGIVSCVSILFSAACILTRRHEESEYQKNLRITEEKAALALSAKALEIKLAELIRLHEKLIESAKELSTPSVWNIDQFNLRKTYDEANKIMASAHADFLHKREKLYQSHIISTYDALLIGMRHALAAYTALVCGVFAAALVSWVLFSAAFPQVIALLTVATGMLLLVSSTIYAFNKAQRYNAEQAIHYENTGRSIEAFIMHEKDKPLSKLYKHLKSDDNSLLKLGLNISLPVYAMFCWTDFARAGFSGILKAIKFIFLSLTLAGVEGYEHNQLIMSLLVIPTATCFALVWAGRALAKYHKDLFGEPSKQAKMDKNSFSVADHTKDANKRGSTSTGLKPDNIEKMMSNHIRDGAITYGNNEFTPLTKKGGSFFSTRGRKEIKNPVPEESPSVRRSRSMPCLSNTYSL